MTSRRLHEVAPGVLMTTSRRYATTSTVLVDGHGGAIVIDPNWDPDELAAIPADLTDLGLACVAGVATHEHYDHVLWHPDLGDPPRWASARTVDDLATDRARLLAPLAEYLTPDLIDVAGRLQPLPDGDLPWDGPRTRIVLHDAHAPGHVALLVEDSGVLVAGDMLSDVELPMPDPDDDTLDTYREGLTRLREAVTRSKLLIPGHGTVTERPVRRWDADMRYLDDLLAGRESDDPRIADPENAGLHAANLVRADRSRNG